MLLPRIKETRRKRGVKGRIPEPPLLAAWYSQREFRGGLVGEIKPMGRSSEVIGWAGGETLREEMLEREAHYAKTCGMGSASHIAGIAPRVYERRERAEDRVAPMGVGIPVSCTGVADSFAGIPPLSGLWMC